MTAICRILWQTAKNLTIVGVVQQAEGVAAGMLETGIGYPADLTRHVMESAAESTIVQEQLADPDTNVLTGTAFGADSQNSFDLESLFSIDEEALQNAFQFDEKHSVSKRSGFRLFRHWMPAPWMQALWICPLWLIRTACL